MFPPEKPRGVDYFIDRQNYTRQFQQLLTTRNVIDVIADTFGTYGTGKTTMLSKLYEDVEANPDFNPIWMSLNLFSTWYLNPGLGERADLLKSSLDVLAQNYVSYHELLVSLSERLFPNRGLDSQLREVSLQRLAALVAGVDLRGGIDQWQEVLSSVADGTINTRDYREAVQTSVHETTAVFLDLYNQAESKQRNVVFADDYCWIGDQPIGDWVLNELGEKMKNTVLVVSRTNDLFDPHERSIEPLRLTNFTPEEVGEYLEKRLTTEYVRQHPELPEAIYHFSDGHAQTICLIADLLKYGDPTTMPDLTPQLTGSQAEHIQGLMHNLLIETEPFWLRESLEIGALTRRFDGELMLGVLKQNPEYVAYLVEEYGDQITVEKDDDDEIIEVTIADDAHDTMIEELLVKLERYSFVEHYHNDRTGAYFAYHGFAGDQMEAVIKADDEAHHMELHERIAAYYAAVLDGYHEQEAAIHEYVKLYRFEDPVWQKDMSEWLYHLSFISSEERKQAHYELVKAYMTAWQWWGWYTHFPYCDHLLTQWKATQSDNPQDVYVLNLLKQFHTNYPLGYAHQKVGAPGWPEVQAALEALMDYFEISIDADYENDYDEDRRWLLATLLEFYAACFRFRRPEPDFQRAEEIYEIADTITQIDDNEFNQSYALAYKAEMYIEQERYADAARAAAESNTVVGEWNPFDVEQDYEAISLNYLTQGQAAAHTGDWQRVSGYFSRTIVTAFAFNFVQLPIPPDPYTVQWAHDTADAIITRLLDRWQAGETTQVLKVLDDLHALWQPYYEQTGEAARIIDLTQALSEQNKQELIAHIKPYHIDLDDPKWQDQVYLESMVQLVQTLFDQLGDE